MKCKVKAHFTGGKELVWLRKIMDEVNKPNVMNELYGNKTY